jgi:hypothetical protein
MPYKKGFDKGWIAVNSMWAYRVKTEGPSLKLWWIVLNHKTGKRWVVKNLKRFLFEKYDEMYKAHQGHRLWYEADRNYFYNELARGSGYPGWKVFKPTRHDYLYNILGTKDLKIFKGAYVKEIPYDDKELQVLMETGQTQDITQFWGNIDFTL